MVTRGESYGHRLDRRSSWSYVVAAGLDRLGKTPYLTSMAQTPARLSSKGQVVIPAWVRRRLHLSPGDTLLVDVGPDEERTIILRSPTRNQVERLLEKGYRWFEHHDVDLVENLHEARRKERRRERRA